MLDEKTLYQVGSKLLADGVDIEDDNAVREALSNCAVPTLYYRVSKADLRRAVYSDLIVYLEDEPAYIAGFKNDCGTVFSKQSYKSWDYAWSTISRVVNRNRRFK